MNRGQRRNSRKMRKTGVDRMMSRKVFRKGWIADMDEYLYYELRDMIEYELRRQLSGSLVGVRDEVESMVLEAVVEIDDDAFNPPEDRDDIIRTLVVNEMESFLERAIGDIYD